MNKKSLPLKRILPGWALVLALALGACGGGGGGDDSGNNNPPPPPTASISSCFTVPSAVTYNIAASGVPAGQVTPSTGSSGPMTDSNGQPVTGQTFNYVGASIKSDTIYWNVTGNGVALLGEITVPTSGNATLTPMNTTFPANMSAGQTAGAYTLVAFENISLGGKTFNNACHMRTSTADEWYAYGYGMVKRATSGGMVVQYNGDTGGSNPTGASITACWTANKTVSFALATTGLPANYAGANRSTVGPMTYQGQAVTGQITFYSGSTATATNYWTVTSSGVTFIANIDYTGAVTSTGTTFLPQNMSPSQTVTNNNNTRYTFVGFETISLSGKTFSNTCHLRIADSQGNSEDAWFAPGYGAIKQVSNGVITQYNGDI